jgi:hypothetical protein
MQPPAYNDSIFINCPFDKEYNPILQAMVFTVYRCGFFPKSALSEDNALDNRLGKIERIIEGCRYGIHDISRTELNRNNLPRFNMPFELGIFFGAKRFGNKDQKNKNALVFDKGRYRYLEFISDLNGVDIKAHNEDPDEVTKKIRNWLTTASRRTTIPGYNKIVADYQKFQAELPGIVKRLSLDIDDIPFNDFCLIVEEYLRSSLS